MLDNQLTRLELDVTRTSTAYRIGMLAKVPGLWHWLSRYRLRALEAGEWRE